MKTFFFIALAWLVTLSLQAQDDGKNFSTANELYSQGKFAGAANAYAKILDTGVQSSALWFNYANAEYKSGHLGEAIAGYRRAALLSPRDADVRANLQFVRNQVQGATVREARWQTWLSTLSLREWTILTVIFFWLTFGLLTLRQLRPQLTARLQSLTRGLAVLLIFFGALLGAQAASHFSGQTAVITTATATARSGPFDDAQIIFTSHDGAELSILDRHDNWVQVTDGAGKSGWLPLKSVAVLPGA